jgi:phage shock protein A
MFRRLSNLVRGFVSLFIGGLEKQNPEALLSIEKENLREQIVKYNQGLASHAGLCERLMTQVKKLETDERDLRSKTSAHLKAGNRDAAGQYAVQLQTVQRELEEDRRQLEQAETTYKELVAARDVAVKAAKAKIAALSHSLNDLKVKQATAELSEMASGMVSQIGGAGDTLDRLSQMVNEEREHAAGRVRVARDSIGSTDVQLQEFEQKALADQALADFAAKEGLALAPTTGTAEAATSESAKSMGPLPQ